jgi:hypothetical protein
LKVDGLTAQNALGAEEPYKLGHPAVRLLLLAGIMIRDGFRHCSADCAAFRSADHLVASNPAPINAPTRNVGWLPTGCGKMPEGSLPDGRDGEAVAKMRREESLLQGGTQRWDDACRII